MTTHWGWGDGVLGAEQWWQRRGTALIEAVAQVLADPQCQHPPAELPFQPSSPQPQFPAPGQPGVVPAAFLPSTPSTLDGEGNGGTSPHLPTETAAAASPANRAPRHLQHAGLQGADLSHKTLSYSNLSHANLSHANLIHLDLSHANLSGANLSWANLTDANLTDADLTGATLHQTQLGTGIGLSEEQRQELSNRGALFHPIDNGSPEPSDPMTATPRLQVRYY